MIISCFLLPPVMIVSLTQNDKMLSYNSFIIIYCSGVLATIAGVHYSLQIYFQDRNTVIIYRSLSLQCPYILKKNKPAREQRLNTNIIHWYLGKKIKSFPWSYTCTCICLVLFLESKFKNQTFDPLRYSYTCNVTSA